MGALQPMHLFVVLAIVLLIFGPGKLPELGKAVGDGMRELKKATNGEAASPSPAPLPAAMVPAGVACRSCGAVADIHQACCGQCGARLASPQAA